MQAQGIHLRCTHLTHIEADVVGAFQGGGHVCDLAFGVVEQLKLAEVLEGLAAKTHGKAEGNVTGGFWIANPTGSKPEKQPQRHQKRVMEAL